jgi:hypothetical protein
LFELKQRAYISTFVLLKPILAGGLLYLVIFHPQVSTLNLFKTILDDQKSLPRDQPHKDLVSLINFVLRKFFKALIEEPFLAVEVHAIPLFLHPPVINSQLSNRPSSLKIVINGNNFPPGSRKRKSNAGGEARQLKIHASRLMCRSRKGTRGATN